MSTTKKVKLVRDSFTIPKPEYLAIDALKARGLTLGLAAKKSEILRAGLMVLSALDDAGLKVALSAVPAVKTGRPRAEANETPAETKPAKTVRATKAKPAPVAAPSAAAAPAPAAEAAAQPKPRARRQAAPAKTAAAAPKRSRTTAAAPATAARKTTRSVKVAK